MDTLALASRPAVRALSAPERALLALPALGTTLLGLGLLLAPQTVAQSLQLPGDDRYVFQLAGAAISGYGGTLIITLFQTNWLSARLPVLATLGFGLALLAACGIELASGMATTALWVLFGGALITVGITGILIVRHRAPLAAEQDLASGAVRVFLALGALSSGTFGLLPLISPQLFLLFHFAGNALFVGRLAGAASLGYALMAILAQRSLNRQALRLPILMAALFNGASAAVSVPAILAGNVLLLPWIIGPFALAVTLGTIVGLRLTFVRR